MHSHENEPIVVQRDVKAIAIPAGVEVNLKLGRSATSRRRWAAASRCTSTAICSASPARKRTPSANPRPWPLKCRRAPRKTTSRTSSGSQLKTCYDPEIPVNIVDLGLVYECDVTRNEDATRTVDIKMTLTAPGCGMGEVLVQDVRDKVEMVPTVTRANVVFTGFCSSH